MKHPVNEYSIQSLYTVLLCCFHSWYISSMESTTSLKRQDAIRNIIYYYTNIVNGVRISSKLIIACCGIDGLKLPNVA